MDQEEEAVAERAGSSACKRQKRNNSAGDAVDGETETATDAAAEEAPAAAAPVAASTPATNVDASALSEMDIILLGFAKNRKEADNVANKHKNNNNNSGADDNTLETQPTNETAPTSSTTTTVTATTTTDANDDDAVASDAADELQVIDVEPDFSEMLFNRPRILSTRSYRSVLTSSSSSSNSNDSSPANDDHNYSTNTSDTNVDDDDVDEVADSSDADEQESPVLVPPADDDSSSDSSMAIWNRYETSSNDPDSDDAYIPTNPNDKLQVDTAVDNIMGKPKPAYGLNLVDQLMYREHNIMNRIDWRGGHTSGMNFIQNYYGSRQVVERMSLTKNMSFHLGCVNSLNFNRSGDLLCSGSDDLSIIVWDWASGKPRQIIRSGHTLNIFQTKFLDSAGCLDIVSSSRDGQVRRAVIPPSGASKIKPMRLYSHAEAVHKLVVVPHSRHEIISVGEDAAVKHFDLRNNKVTSMLRCTDNKRRVRLFSIAHHPFAPEFCISGSDDKLRVYDKRQLNKPVHEMTPKDIKDVSRNCSGCGGRSGLEKITQITCAVYNHSGSEILASYSDAGIYLYDSRNYKDGEYLHSYEGHINSRTIKGVNFFGPRSEYVVSGSDCGNIFFWDKNTEAVINLKKGDLSGVVNCLEPHPWMPVLATSGLEHKVKIWTPSGLPEALPKPEVLKETLQRNFRRSILDLGEFDINHIHYFIRQLIDPRLGSSAGARAGADPARRYSSSSSDSSSNPNSPPGGGGQPSSSDEGNPNPMGCNTQ
ncbi:DDB1- and CUL4-associated factor 8 isoform X1 [Drosophila sulfurigaster albostrigata]|uniref:DDB1- and CUL4-associated factor 8 isoform X1 n=1 Tax=Drosophila sulfurigaster albostrigata TaxID=89887 RepID=UPI002D21C5CA|nr:DDB1- and CUL4-associated factor 8 isoform X1 [Drosophila sulfurigaster albostrigata]